MTVLARTRRLTSKLNRYIGNPLEWQSSSKAMLLGVVTGLFYFHYALLASFLVSPGNESVWINSEYLARQIPWFYGFAGFSLLLILGTYITLRIKGDSVLFEYVAAMYFALSLCFFSYHIGTLSLPVGSVMVGAPVVGFIFFNRTAVMLALFVAVGVQMLLSFGAAWQWWPYAPVFAEGTAQLLSPSAFTVFQLYLFTFPHMIFLIVVSYLVLRRWRDREERVRLLSITDPLTGLFNRRSTR